ncbi:hypothetical protein A2U01_0022916, partial [Trifolium medium]|nr:hypothetical protein [Trifolium medium]
MGDDDDLAWQTVKGRHSQRRGNNQYRIDVATTRNYNKENNIFLTTYFFTDFPESFGAKAMFN